MYLFLKSCSMWILEYSYMIWEWEWTILKVYIYVIAQIRDCYPKVHGALGIHG